MSKVLENKLRRKAERLGLSIKKSRAKMIHINDFGGYTILDPQINAVIAGPRFELELEDVQAWLDECEMNLQKQA